MSTRRTSWQYRRRQEGRKRHQEKYQRYLDRNSEEGVAHRSGDGVQDFSSFDGGCADWDEFDPRSSPMPPIPW